MGGASLHSSRDSTIPMETATWRVNKEEMGSGVEGAILKALRSQTKSLTLDNSGLQVLPDSISKLHFLHTLSAKNNSLKSLPLGFVNLKSVRCPCYNGLTDISLLSHS